MHPDHIVHGHGKKPEGIVLTQVFLGGKGQVSDIFKLFDISRFDPGLVHLVPVIRDLVVYPGDQFLQSFQLQSPHRLSGHCFMFIVQDHLSSFLVI